VRVCTAYVISSIRHVIASFGPRAPGSDAEYRAQRFIKDELAQYMDGEVKLEPFPVHPKAFMGFAPVAAVLLLISTVLYWTQPWAAVACDVIALAVTLFELGLYWQFLDPLFPKRTSYNAVGVQPPRREVKRRIILGGHIDAAYEWRYHLLHPALLKLMILGSTASLGYKIVTDVINALFLGPPASPMSFSGILGITQIVLTPFFVALFFFSRFSRTVPGANDNLTGTFIALAVVKYLQETGTRFDHTEVRCLITGSEEAGLRGAKAYVKAHVRELQDVPTIFLGLETLRDIEHLSVFTHDLNGAVKHDPQVCALLREAGRRCRRELPDASVFLGSSDAAAFTQGGIRSGLLGAMDPAPARYYHTRLDDADNLSPECIQAALEITLAALELYDAEGLPPNGGQLQKEETKTCD